MSLRVPSANKCGSGGVIRTIGDKRLSRGILGHTIRQVLGMVFSCISRERSRTIFSESGSRRGSMRVRARYTILLRGGNILPVGRRRGVICVNRFTRGPHCRNNKSDRVGSDGMISTLRTTRRGGEGMACIGNFSDRQSRVRTRRMRGTIRTTGRTSVTIIFTNLPSTFRSRDCSQGSVGLPTYRGRLVRRITGMRPGLIIILRGKDPIRAP